MDPVAIALSLFMQNPAAVGSAVQQAMTPGTVNVATMQGSLVDLSRGVLHCYHRTARFRSTDLLGTRWNRQSQYGAENSGIVRINYEGMSGMSYQMVVAVLVKQDKVRTAVLADTAIVPYNKRCQLEEWTGA